MKIVELGEVAYIDRNTVDAEAIEDGTLYVGLEHITSDGNFERVSSVSKGELNSTKFKFRKDHILYGKLRPYLRKIALPSFQGVCSTDILPIQPKATIDKRFLFYCLRQQSMIDLATAQATGANLPRLSPSRLLEFPIPLPPLAEQKRLARILDVAAALQAQRRATLTKLDTLLQSTFLHLFGDPVHSPYPIMDLDSACEVITDGAHLTPTYVNEGMPFLRVTDIQTEKIDWGNTKKIPYEEHVELCKRCKPQRGDVLYSKNGTIGIPKLVNWDEEFSIFVSLALLRPKVGILLGSYLESFLATPFALRQAMKHTKTGTVSNLHLVEIRKVRLPVPDLETQQEWLRIKERIKKHHQQIVNAQLELNTLFQSLQQRAFRGELSPSP